MFAHLPLTLGFPTTTVTAVFPTATAPCAPISSGEVHTLPYMTHSNSTGYNHSVVDQSGAPPPPQGEGELLILPDASVVPRAVDLIGANLSSSNETQPASNNGSEAHSSAYGRTLFVIVMVAGVALIMGLIYGVTRAVIKYRRDKTERAVGRAVELQRWPGAHSKA